MNLRDYLHENGITQEAFGRMLSPAVSQGKVNHWLHGARRVSLAEALQIERLTQGRVTLQELAQLAPVSSGRRSGVTLRRKPARRQAGQAVGVGHA